MQVYYQVGLLLLYKYMLKRILHHLHQQLFFSLESVFAAIAAWIILKQYLEIDNIIGCTFILAGVIFSQILPEVKKTNNK